VPNICPISVGERQRPRHGGSSDKHSPYRCPLPTVALFETRRDPRARRPDRLRPSHQKNSSATARPPRGFQSNMAGGVSGCHKQICKEIEYGYALGRNPRPSLGIRLRNRRQQRYTRPRPLDLPCLSHRASNLGPGIRMAAMPSLAHIVHQINLVKPAPGSHYAKRIG
jgi:hypothetical protein